jgi:hypothetical protein
MARLSATRQDHMGDVTEAPSDHRIVKKMRKSRCILNSNEAKGKMAIFL